MHSFRLVRTFTLLTTEGYGNINTVHKITANTLAVAGDQQDLQAILLDPTKGSRILLALDILDQCRFRRIHDALDSRQSLAAYSKIFANVDKCFRFEHSLGGIERAGKRGGGKAKFDDKGLEEG